MELSKKCSNLYCDNITIYKNEKCYLNGLSKNTRCRSCSKKEISEETRQKMRDAKKGQHKGKTYTEIYGLERGEQLRKQHSKSMKGRPMKHHWKVTEARKKNGTYKHTEEYKKWLSQTSVFNKSGIDHIHLKKYLERHNLTVEDYEKTLTDYKKYRKKVVSITKKQPIHLLENFDKLRGKAGVAGAYQLDHIISVFDGFNNNMSAEQIGDISNLQFIPWEENLAKNKKCNRLIIKKDND